MKDSNPKKVPKDHVVSVEFTVGELTALYEYFIKDHFYLTFDDVAPGVGKIAKRVKKLNEEGE